MTELTYEDYLLLYKSGMFFEWFPDATGNYEHDKLIIIEWLKYRELRVD